VVGRGTPHIYLPCTTYLLYPLEASYTKTGVVRDFVGVTKVNIFGIGLPEMALIMVVALLVFGPKKLPEIGRSMGKAIRGFQEASREFESEFKQQAEQLEQAVQTTAELEPKQIAAAQTENHTATPSQQS